MAKPTTSKKVDNFSACKLKFDHFFGAPTKKSTLIRREVGAKKMFAFFATFQIKFNGRVCERRRLEREFQGISQENSIIMISSFSNFRWGECLPCNPLQVPLNTTCLNHYFWISIIRKNGNLLSEAKNHNLLLKNVGLYFVTIEVYEKLKILTE